MDEVTREDTPWRRIPSFRCPAQAARSRTIRCWPAVLREGARRLLKQAVEAEVEAFLAARADLTDEGGRRRVVRNGHAPERRLQTGIGAVEVRRPRVRDRGDGSAAPIRFTSAIPPPYLLRPPDPEPRGAAALALPQGRVHGTVRRGAGGAARPRCSRPVSPATVRRLTEAWQEEHEHWQRRDLSIRRYVCPWADGVYLTPRLDHDRRRLLVLVGADASGRKELPAIDRGRLA